MVTLKKFFDSEQRSLDGYVRVLDVLAEGIALHAIDLDPALRQEFQTAIRAAARKIREATTDTTVLMHSGEVIQGVQQYHRALEKAVALEASEKQAILSMVTGCLIRMTRGSEVSGASLRSLEKQLEKANQLDDIRSIKEKIGVALKVVQDEAARQERIQKECSDQVERTLGHPTATAKGSDSEFDPITGLGNAKAAEIAIRAMFTEDRLLFPVAFFLERLDLINTRFGFEGGDRVLAAFSQRLAQYIKSDEVLFRWRGPSFVALLDRKGNFDAVRAELKRIAATKFEHSLRVGERDVLLSLTCATASLPVSAETGHEELVARINKFVAEQTARFSHPA